MFSELLHLSKEYLLNLIMGMLLNVEFLILAV